jgi:hypothetical protein
MMQDEVAENDVDFFGSVGVQPLENIGFHGADGPMEGRKFRFGFVGQEILQVDKEGLYVAPFFSVEEISLPLTPALSLGERVNSITFSKNSYVSELDPT